MEDNYTKQIKNLGMSNPFAETDKMIKNLKETYGDKVKVREYHGETVITVDSTVDPHDLIAGELFGKNSLKPVRESNLFGSAKPNESLTESMSEFRRNGNCEYTQSVIESLDVPIGGIRSLSKPYITLSDVKAKREHIKTCLDVLNTIYPSGDIHKVIYSTVLNHDIGYDRTKVEHIEINDHTLRGYFALKGSNIVEYDAILLHGKLTTCDVSTSYKTLLMTYVIDYCDIHSGPNGEKFTIAQRLEEIGKRYGNDSVTFKLMSGRLDYYNCVEANIQTIAKSLLSVLNR